MAGATVNSSENPIFSKSAAASPQQQQQGSSDWSVSSVKDSTAAFDFDVANSKPRGLSGNVAFGLP